MDVESQALPVWSNSLCWLQSCQSCSSALCMASSSQPHSSYSSQGCRDLQQAQHPNSTHLPQTTHEFTPQPTQGAWDTNLPSSRSLRGPYLSMTIPRGSVIALSRKDPMVKAKFSISSWALQEGHLSSEAVLFSSLGLLVVFPTQDDRGLSLQCVRMGLHRCRKERREKPRTQGATAHQAYALRTAFCIIISEKWRRERRAAEDKGNLMSSAGSRKRVCRHPGDKYPKQQQDRYSLIYKKTNYTARPWQLQGTKPSRT